jgi:hypothetical protein
MNPPNPGGKFYKDLLPFGFIEADGRVPSDHKIVRSNWNSELPSMKLSNSSAQLPKTMLLALTGAAGIWGCFRLRKFVRKSQVRLGVLN